MDVKYINPVLSALINVLSTMVGIDVQPGKPELKKDNISPGAVTGFIDMSGSNVKGSIAIAFSRSIILDVARKLLGIEPVDIDEEVQDVVGEFTNMIAGGAKNNLGQIGVDIGMSTPKVINGQGQVIEHSVDAPVISLELRAETGTIYVEICFAPQTASAETGR